MSTTKIEFANGRSQRLGHFSRFLRRRPPAIGALTGAVMLVCGLAASVVAQQPGPAAVPVGTVIAERKPIAQTADFVGRIQAIERVDIQARITGYLEQVLFKEGETVKEGQPLYRIEKDLFKAEVEQAQGALEASKAKKLLTAIQYERAEQLTKTSAGTVVARDQALTADRSAAAQILIDQANLDFGRDQSRLYRHQRADLRQDRPHDGDEGQCRQPAERHADHDRQSGPDIRAVSGEPARADAGAEGGERGGARRHQGEAALCRRHGLRLRWKDRLRRRHGRQGDRYGAGQSRFSQPEGGADRRPAGDGQSRVRDAAGTGRGAAVGLDRRPARAFTSLSSRTERPRSAGSRQGDQAVAG